MISNKKLSTIKFHNFLRSSIFVLRVSSSKGHLQKLNFKSEKLKRSFCIRRLFQI